MLKRALKLCLIFLVFLAGCDSPPTATPLPTPEPIFVVYPPELRPQAEALAACGRQYADMAIFIIESVEVDSIDGQENLFLAFGELPERLQDWYATWLGNDSVAIIIHQQNPLDSLSEGQLRAIWNGETENWKSLMGDDEAIQVWTYPEGSELRNLFDRVLIKNGRISPQAWLAPDPQAVAEAVAADPNAIGYLPISWMSFAPSEITDHLKMVSLPDAAMLSLQQPILAVTETEPQGALRTLLLCYQAGVFSPVNYNSSGKSP